jgi:hypothetical protein
MHIAQVFVVVWAEVVKEQYRTAEGSDHGSSRRAKAGQQETREDPGHWRMAHFYLRPMSPLRITAENPGKRPWVDLHDLL